MIIKLYKKSYLSFFVTPHNVAYENDIVFVTPRYFNDIIVNEHGQVFIDSLNVGKTVPYNQAPMICESCKFCDRTYWPNKCMHESNIVVTKIVTYCGRDV